MKRRTKLFLFLASLTCLILIGCVLSQIQKRAAEPFPGAVVVLDDASWRARHRVNILDGDYVWGGAGIVFYRQQAAGGDRIIRRRILPNGTTSPPEMLPMILRGKQHIESVSPDGTTLCLFEFPTASQLHYHFVRTDGKGKSVRIKVNSIGLLWLPDSRHLYGRWSNGKQLFVDRYDIHTGTGMTTKINPPKGFGFNYITLQGKLLGLSTTNFFFPAPKKAQWDIADVQGSKIVMTKHQKAFDLEPCLISLSPDGKRILWQMEDKSITLWERWQKRLMGKKIEEHPRIRFHITDFDGGNEREIGVATEKQREPYQLYPDWTADGKGVHFLYEGKLMYLPVP